MAVIGPLSEEDANRLLRTGSVAGGLTSIHMQMGDKVEDDPLVAMVIGEELAAAIVQRWNAPLLGPRSAAEYRGDFARRPLPNTVPAPRS